MRGIAIAIALVVSASGCGGTRHGDAPAVAIKSSDSGPSTSKGASTFKSLVQLGISESALRATGQVSAEREPLLGCKEYSFTGGQTAVVELRTHSVVLIDYGRGDQPLNSLATGSPISEARAVDGAITAPDGAIWIPSQPGSHYVVQPLDGSVQSILLIADDVSERCKDGVGLFTVPGAPPPAVASPSPVEPIDTCLEEVTLNREARTGLIGDGRDQRPVRLLDDGRVRVGDAVVDLSAMPPTNTAKPSGVGFTARVFYRSGTMSSSGEDGYGVVTDC